MLASFVRNFLPRQQHSACALPPERFARASSRGCAPAGAACAAPWLALRRLRLAPAPRAPLRPRRPVAPTACSCLRCAPGVGSLCMPPPNAPRLSPRVPPPLRAARRGGHHAGRRRRRGTRRGGPVARAQRSGAAVRAVAAVIASVRPSLTAALPSGFAPTPPCAAASCATWRSTCRAATRSCGARWRRCGRCGAAWREWAPTPFETRARGGALTSRAPACRAQPRGALSDSLARCLLGVPCLQTAVAEALLHRLPLAAADAGSDLPAALLAQFRWLDHVSDAKELTHKVLEVLMGCPPAVQKGACANAALRPVLSHQPHSMQTSSPSCPRWLPRRSTRRW